MCYPCPARLILAESLIVSFHLILCYHDSIIHSRIWNKPLLQSWDYSLYAMLVLTTEQWAIYWAWRCFHILILPSVFLEWCPQVKLEWPGMKNLKRSGPLWERGFIESFIKTIRSKHWFIHVTVQLFCVALSQATVDFCFNLVWKCCSNLLFKTSITQY